MNDIRAERSHMVVKANDLIQKSRYSLSLQEQRIVQYMISKITPEAVDLEEVDIDIKDICKVINVDHDSGGNYEHIRKTMKNIRDRSIWIELPNGDETTFAWFSTVIIRKHSGLVTLCFDKQMAPFLLQLNRQYTQYSLYFTLAMKSTYSIRLYELLKSYQNLGAATFSVDDLRKRLDATASYCDKFGVFRQKVLDGALKEIADFSDLDVKMETLRTGRVIDRVKFTIKEFRNGYAEVKELFERIDKNIGAKNKAEEPMPNQIGISDLT